MIEIRDKRDCCGCNACVQKCPRQCIEQFEDAEGFVYPRVDKARCIGCGLCEKVCPVIDQNPESKPLQVLAGWNGNEEIRMQSSSGGVFTLLAEQIIGRGGVVFGARFDENWEVVHGYTESMDGLAAFRGSKYVQSRIGEAFRQGHSCNRAAKYYSPGHPARLRDCTGSSGKNTAICSPWTSYATGYPARAYGKNTWRGSLQIYLRRAGSTGFISGINAPDGKSTVSLPAFHLLKKRPCILKNFTGTCTCADSSPIYICVHPAIGVRQNRANPGLILPWRIFGGSNV